MDLSTDGPHESSTLRFRSILEWQTALLTLPDTAYFELMRSVFGNIKTPFNKHRLIEDLTRLLTRGDIQEIINAYIDEQDSRIITAVGLLHEPASGDLERFFAGDYSFIDLHAQIINLEERLILYRFSEGGISRLALNPLLEPILRNHAREVSTLFPVELNTAIADTPPPPTLEDHIAAALIAFILDESELYKTEGGIRKKAQDEWKRIFPRYELQDLLGCFLNLGLIAAQERRMTPNWKNLKRLGMLSPQERKVYFASGLYCHYAGSSTPGEELLQVLGWFIHHFMQFFEPDFLYPLKTIQRIFTIFARNRELKWEESELAPLDGTNAQLFCLLKALEGAGLLLPYEAGWGLPRHYPDREGRKGVCLAMDSPYSYILFPEIELSDALILSSFSSVRETGTVVRFELTRDSVVRGFNLGLSAEATLQHLERLSGSPGDQNLQWTVKDWENRYSAVSLHQGIVLILREERQYLADTEPIASCILRTLAPGVYLVAGNSIDSIAQTLQKAGIDIVARPGEHETIYSADETTLARQEALEQNPYPPLGRGILAAIPVEVQAKLPASIPHTEDSQAAETYKAQFHRILHALGLPKSDAEELSARIDRRLILMESQLSASTVKNEKLEARNLDYAGKSMIAKQAIALKALVEILSSNANGDEIRLLGVPQSMEKSGGESILVVQIMQEQPPTSGITQPLDAASNPKFLRMESQREILRLPLGKIRLIRRIKQSIFGE